MPNRAAARASSPGAAGERRPGALTTEAVIRAAIELADTHGLEAVSIRRVAAALRARPMSLYTHIASKDALFDLMTDDVFEAVANTQTSAGDWRAEVSQLARAFDQAFVDHPWLIRAFRQGRRPGPHTLHYSQRLAGAVADLDVPAETAWSLLGVVNDYTLGHALRVATAGHARTLNADGRAIANGDALESVNARRGTTESFELGLETVLDGIEARLSKRDDGEHPR
jgi:AcrR family transcriptional regulator